MKGNRDRIYPIIQESALGEDQKLEMFKMLQHANDEYFKGMADLLESKPEMIIDIYQNFKSKQEALRDDNLGAFEKIFDDEKDLVRSLGNKKE